MTGEPAQRATAPVSAFPRRWSISGTRRSTLPRPVVLGAAAIVAVVAIALPQFAPSVRTDGSGFRELLDENFDGHTLNSAAWNTCYPWGCTIASNDEQQWYQRSQVTVADGELRLTAEARPTRASDGSWFPYRSGMISSGPAEPGGGPTLAFTYGTVEARLRIPAGKGLWSALWLLPAFGDSRPEVDIVEILGDDTRVSYHTLQRENRRSKPFQGVRRGADLADGWHVYRLVWLPQTLLWYVDGALVHSVHDDEVPDEPMYVIADLAVGGSWPGSPNRRTRFPASMTIDYLRIELKEH